MARLSININDDMKNTLKMLADKDDVTVTEVVRRSISVYKLLKHQQDSYKSIQFWDPVNKTTTEILLF